MCYNEFVYVHNRFSAEQNEFYGPHSPLTYNQQKEFLSAYLNYARRNHGEQCLVEKAVSNEQKIQGLGKVQRNSEVFSAYKRKHASEYKGWQFYTDRAYVKDGTLILADGSQFPVPCAKYKFLGKLNAVRLQIKIDGSYYHKSAEGILPTTTGRCSTGARGVRRCGTRGFPPAASSSTNGLLRRCATGRSTG